MCLCAQVPIGLPNRTTRLFLNKNLLTSLAADMFSSLFLLDELDLSHNQVVNSSSYQFRVCTSLIPVRHSRIILFRPPQLSSLEDGCFRGLDSLTFLDLSYNRLSTLELPVLGGLQIEANLTHNPWHCDCRMEVCTDAMMCVCSSHKVITTFCLCLDVHASVGSGPDLTSRSCLCNL